MTLPRTARPAYQRRSQATLERLLGAAEEMLRESGLEGATVEAIARRAGVSPAIIYRRFPDKDALLQATYERYFLQRDAANAAALDPGNWRGRSVAEIVSSVVAGAIEGARQERLLVVGLHRLAATHKDPEFREFALRVNAATHARLVTLLENAAPDADRERLRPMLPLAVDALLFCLRGYLVEAAAPGDRVPDSLTLRRELALLVCRYLGLDNPPGDADVGAKP